jgi:hypothetical protein
VRESDKTNRTLLKECGKKIMDDKDESQRKKRRKSAPFGVSSLPLVRLLKRRSAAARVYQPHAKNRHVQEIGSLDLLLQRNFSDVLDAASDRPFVSFESLPRESEISSSASSLGRGKWGEPNYASLSPDVYRLKDKLIRGKWKEKRTGNKKYGEKEAVDGDGDGACAVDNDISSPSFREREIYQRYTDPATFLIRACDIANVLSELQSCSTRGLPFRMKGINDNDDDDVNDGNYEPSCSCESDEDFDVATNGDDDADADDRVARPSWLPAGWKPGDPRPAPPIDEDPNWDVATASMDPEAKNELRATLNRIGGNARNQLARPEEYLVQARWAARKLFDLFAGRPGDRWFYVVYPELEMHYDGSATVSGFVSSFCFSFVGDGFPKREVWEPCAKIENLALRFEKLETEFYAMSSDPKNPYKPKDRLASDFSTKLFYSTPCPNDHRSGNSEPADPDVDDLSFRWTTPLDDEGGFGPLQMNAFELKDDLDRTPFSKSYFCNLFGNPDHPTLSDREGEDRFYGHPEMLARERTEREEALRKLRLKSSIQRDGSKKTPVAKNATLPCPKLSALSRMIAPKSQKIYVNGLLFREKNASEMKKVWPAKRSDAVGFNVLKSKMESFRVSVCTGFCSVHFADHHPAPIVYPNKDELDEYLSACRFALEKNDTKNSTVATAITTNATTTTTTTTTTMMTTIEEEEEEEERGKYAVDPWAFAKLSEKPPLLSEEDWIYCREKGINIPADFDAVRSRQLPGMIKRLVKNIEDETGTAPKTYLPSVKKQRTSTKKETVIKGKNPAESAVLAPNNKLDKYFTPKKK